MALTPPPTVHEYWPKYWRRSLSLIVLIQVLVVLVVGLALMIFDIVEPTNIVFLVILIAMLFTTIALNWIGLTLVSEPIKQLTAAIAKTEGEQTQLLPPNPNTPRYEKSGLKALLLSIYAQSVHDENVTSTAQNSADDVLDAFEKSSSAVILLDENYQPTRFTKNAPVHTTPDSGNLLELMFLDDISINEWIKRCDEKSVSAERTWSRVGNKPVGDPDRKIYDIAASYRKGSKYPVSILLIEKTNEYAPEDNDLNFIAFAAHELRGPITVIRGYLDTLEYELEGQIDAEQKELFERLIVSANRLTSYINNILNSARYDRRHFTVRLVETTVAGIYASIADDMALRASSQARLLSVDLPADLPHVAADPSSISEVLSNLVDNAIKYSHEGGAIEIRAERAGDYIAVSVKDHGIGMPANVVGNLFHKFYRSHRSRETVAGTGIGLYISKAIVESNGGTMEVRSVEGEGSTFTFTLPLYAKVAADLAKNGGDNREFIAHNSGSWIRNHGQIRG